MFKMQFETDNAAFEDAGTEEIARILRNVADKLGNGSGAIRDYNGNKVGEWECTFTPS